ncbi:MAG: sulfatase-like hydrolase/transferase, partial [Draconibacterium sp.]|nr:sulfatase-like hydrolase/transferase [Draconibacterium sp.]
YMGQLAEVIKKAGIEENTLVIFTSDNGCSPRADFEDLIAKDHNPSANYRGHKADIFEGGHRVPFIVKWPKEIVGGEVCDQTICTTDLMATCAAIANQKLADNAGEDSFSILPLFKNPESKEFNREATVHHSINGSFSIRKGDWKLILCPGSGGWSYPRPKKDKMDNLPPFQLYNLKDDIGEKNNLYNEKREIADELKQLLADYINNGRSTPGPVQENDEAEKWPQISWINN